MLIFESEDRIIKTLDASFKHTLPYILNNWLNRIYLAHYKLTVGKNKAPLKNKRVQIIYEIDLVPTINQFLFSFCVMVNLKIILIKA